MAKASEPRNGRSAAEIPAAVVPSMEPLLTAGNKLFETWMAMGTEILEFSRARLDQSIEASRQLARTGSINEAIDLQAKFTRTMVQDYLAEANKIADMSTRGVIESFGVVQESAKAATSQFTPRLAAE
jgi:phasin family protein